MTFEEAATFIRFRDKIGLTVIIVALIVGLPGGVLNVLVWSQKNMRVGSTSLYLLALSLADLMYMFSSCVNQLQYTELTSYEWFRNFHAKISVPFAYLYFSSSYLSIFITVAMTIERYIVISMPMKAGLLCTRRKALIICLLLTFIVLGYNISVLLMFQTKIYFDVFKSRLNVIYTLSPLGLRKTFNTIYKYVNLYFKLVIPFILLAVFNTLIIRKLHQSKKCRRQMTKAQAEETGHEEAITKMLVVLVVSFLILTLPIIAANILSALFHVKYAFSYRGSILTAISETIYMLNPVINFFIFGGLNQKFRMGLRDLCCAGSDQLRHNQDLHHQV